jgi:hypothetical protein
MNLALFILIVETEVVDAKVIIFAHDTVPYLSKSTVMGIVADVKTIDVSALYPPTTIFPVVK